MPAHDLLPMAFKITAKFGVPGEVDQRSFIGKRINDTMAAPEHMTARQILRHRQRQLSILFNIQLSKFTDKYLVCASSNAYSHLATNLFKYRIISFQSLDEESFSRQIKYPRRASRHDACNFTDQGVHHYWRMKSERQCS